MKGNIRAFKWRPFQEISGSDTSRDEIAKIIGHVYVVQVIHVCTVLSKMIRKSEPYRETYILCFNKQNKTIMM